MGIFSFLFRKKLAPTSEPIPESLNERRTVVFQSSKNKVCEVGGITIESSIVIKKFTEEEIRENANQNYWFYEPAYQQVMATIEADPKQIKAMFNDLLVAHAAGSPRRKMRLLSSIYLMALGDGQPMMPLFYLMRKPAIKKSWRT